MNKLAKELVAILSTADDVFSMDPDESSEAFVAVIEGFTVVIDNHGDEPLRKFLPIINLAAKRIHRGVISMGSDDGLTGPEMDAITLVTDCRGAIDRTRKSIGRR